MESYIQELINRGMECLCKTLGVVEAERFIAEIKKESFDYTKWRESFFDRMTEDEFMDEAVDYARAHSIKAKVVV